MKYTRFLLALILVLGLAAVSYYVYLNVYTKAVQQTLTPPIVLPSFPPTQSPESSSANIPVDWIPFDSPQFGYRIYHPLEVKAETNSEGDRFIKSGPTQSLGTELYDGIVVLIRRGSLNGMSLEQKANARANEAKEEETTRSVSAVVPVQFGAHKGFQFHQSSFGDGDFIYLEKKDGEYLEIINSTVEPKNREQTFQEVVRMMLSSLII